MASPVILSDQRIHEIAVARVSQNASRNERYDKAFSYYTGDIPSNPNRSDVRNMDIKGRPLLRSLGPSATAENRYFVNRVAPIIEDYRALIGRVPRVRVDPPDSSQQGEQKAGKLTRYLLSTYELSDMDFQQAEAGLYLPLLGDVGYVLEVDVEDIKPEKGGRVAISAVNPRYGYPSFKKGFRRFQLRDLVIAFYEEEEVLESEYGYKSKDRDDRLLVTYLSPFQRTVLVGKTRLAHAEFNLGFCPAEWASNRIVSSGGGKEQYGHSDIREVMGLQDYENWLISVASDATLYSTYGVLLMTGAEHFTQDMIELGPGAVVTANVGGDLKSVATGAHPEVPMKIADGIQKDIYTAAGTTSVRMEGDQHSSIQTGRGLHAAQGPQATRLDLKQSLLSATLEHLNQKVMRMQEMIPELQKPIEIWGRQNGREFREDFDPVADIDGWYRNHVSWDNLVGVNQQQRIVMAMQGMAANLFDDIKAREVAGEEDPLGMRERVKAWKIEEAEIQSAQQHAAQGGGGQPQDMQAKPGVANVQFPGHSSQGGAGQPGPGGGGAPAQSMPFRPPQMGQGRPPAGIPQGTSLPQVEMALQAVTDKLKGTVFAVGELARMGQSMAPELAITDYKDHGQVLAALKPLSPAIKVKAMSEEALPEGSVRVA